jgi:hypothetical protein
MFAGGGHDFVAPSVMSPSGAEQSKVVGLGSTRGEENLLLPSAQRFSYMASRYIKLSLSLNAHSVKGGRIAPASGQNLLHFFNDTIVWTGGRTVIQINCFQ